MTNPKGYVKHAYTGIDFYKSYCEYVKDNPLYQVEYKLFRAIINDYFRYLRDEILEEGKEIKLPCRLGSFSIIKHKPKNWNGKSLRIDYGETKKQGKIIYHLNEHSGYYKYRGYWNKQSMNTKNKSKYQLVMTRANKRRLAFLIKHKVRDFIEL